jgi:hypothetical protein
MKSIHSMKCPACSRPLPKHLRDTLSELEWQKFQTSLWMAAWMKDSGWFIKKKGKTK